MGLFDALMADIKTFVKHTVLCPGNVVEGYVKINAMSSIDVVGVHVELTAEEIVTVSQTYESGRDSQGNAIMHTDEYTASNAVLRQRVTLAGSTPSSGDSSALTVPRGTWTYPFALQLPRNMPATYIHRCGNHFVSFVCCVKARYVMTNGRDGGSHTSYLTVIRPMPIFQWRAPAPKYRSETFETSCCHCISEGKASVRASMRRTVVSMDRDRLQVSCNIDNSDGKVAVNGIELTLVRLVKYSAPAIGLERTTDRKSVANITCSRGIGAGKNGEVDCELVLPRGIPPTQHTAFVSIEYALQVELNISFSLDPSFTFPVGLAQLLDETDAAASVDFSSNNFTFLRDESYTEYAYSPPPSPVYPYLPIPSATTQLTTQGATISYAAFTAALFPLPAPSLGILPSDCYPHQKHNARVPWLAGMQSSLPPAEAESTSRYGATPAREPAAPARSTTAGCGSRSWSTKATSAVGLLHSVPGLFFSFLLSLLASQRHSKYLHFSTL